MPAYAEKDIAAIILAAGRSERMGQFKPLMSIGEETVIERVIGLFHQTGILGILVVVGCEAELLRPVVEKLGVRGIANPDWEQGMFSSVQAGVRQLDASCRAFFLMPADMPLVCPGTIRALLEAFNKENADVCRPVHGGKRGHPPLISASLIRPILDEKEPAGLRALLARYQSGTVEVACDDPGILIDLDTPDDLKKAAFFNVASEAG
jgi:CTP:molybdopterin cytidylyltransferase MocA